MTDKTDKEIIINGINVAGCEFIEDCLPTADCKLLCGYCYEFDCYYKQLQREKQNNECLQRLNEELKEFKNRLLRPVILPMNDEPEIINLTNRYKQALKEIKEISTHCEKQDTCTLCDYADKCRDEFDYCSYNVCRMILGKINEVLKDV